ncbi:hypothetical protein LSH36_294g00020 [Paralvinella palmiformis]|uniref:WW domain-containing protein n=1 Tax=Paralvinella palmiformis TaxID=53620 RepID=A0AAD9JIB8_9ANNE|nr:hypothetical protein LSH36_294g00020 [Paralvinella palmiformis]
MSRRGFGRRRTVLQLDDTPQKRESYGLGYKPASDKPKEACSSIGALDMMAHYDDSGEEEDKEDENVNSGPAVISVQKFVASSERLEPTSQMSVGSPLHSKVTNGRSVSPDTTKPNKPKDEIDSKVLDFLAELETIDGPDTTSGDTIDGDPLPGTPEDGSDNDNNADPEPKPPIEPTTQWQQCLDEGTQCYYYWHFVTNEVTWEIPAEYSQYLLQYKEYEDLLPKYEKERADWEKQKAQHSTKNKKKKNVVGSLVPYTDSSQPEVKLESEVPSTSLKQENAASSSPKTSVPKAVKVENISTDNTQLPVHGPLLPSQHPQPSEDYPQMVADSVISRLPESTVESSAMIGPQLPPAAPSQPESSANVTVIGPELPSSSSHMDKPANGGKDKSDDSDSLFGDDMDVDEYIHRKLEEPVFNKYESVKQKSEVPQPETGDEKPAKDEVSDDLDIVSDDLDIDVDTIDRELEKALERKKSELQSKNTDVTITKRKAPNDDPPGAENSQANKKRKTGNSDLQSRQSPADENDVSRVYRDDIKKRVNCLAEVSELSNLVTDKLDFLEITNNGLSKLQILLVQLETRTQDWKCGGLSTDHFLHKLREANEQLEQYEASAAPDGWSCHWDRYAHFVALVTMTTAHVASPRDQRSADLPGWECLNCNSVKKIKHTSSKLQSIFFLVNGLCVQEIKMLFCMNIALLLVVAFVQCGMNVAKKRRPEISDGRSG